ncbi:DUF2218 domain-containing protein [Sphingomonas turrisvirgatae]|uniref:2,4-dihydroxyhept-2-ene-1,7-dioic acid aldolase n=1 Tax=Sphingomonas turrisvirgatae TaxID=1888892 RepID=A0A1E3LX23_9SPHN|nr:DUF2218 domain-containing protein [Sphingomonas turrisvirgatae]ODP38278.1 hypothetical protein BFL28_15010 [Sphingomonas turrisvirgatae]
MVSATGFARTDKASRYLQQLCKHWEHNLKVEFTADRGTIVFPKDARGADWPADALVTLDARPDGMAIRIDASADGQLDGLKGAVERHIDRFAFREAPLTYEWG